MTSTEDVASSVGITNISKELEVTDELSRTINVLEHYKKLYPKDSPARKMYTKQSKSLKSKRKKLRDKTIRGSLDNYVPG